MLVRQAPHERRDDPPLRGVPRGRSLVGSGALLGGGTLLGLVPGRFRLRSSRLPVRLPGIRGGLRLLLSGLLLRRLGSLLPLLPCGPPAVPRGLAALADQRDRGSDLH